MPASLAVESGPAALAAVRHPVRDDQGYPATMELVLALLACVVLALVLRERGDGYYGIFRHRNLRSPGDDGLGRPRGIQEDDSVEPWRTAGAVPSPDEAAQPTDDPPDEHDPIGRRPSSSAPRRLR